MATTVNDWMTLKARACASSMTSLDSVSGLGLGSVSSGPDLGSWSRPPSFDSGLGPSTKTEGSLSSETKTTRKVSHQSSEADSSDAIYCFICDEELGVKLTKGC